MTLLPDQLIKQEMMFGDLEVSPVDLEEQLQPASLDIRMGEKFSVEKGENYIIDSREDTPSVDYLERTIEDSLLIDPGEFLLVNTKEHFSIPDYLIGEVTGRSSIGRLGITVHQTAGLFDPGFEGQGVLEIKNVSKSKIHLYPGQRVAQMTFQKLEEPAQNPYNSEDNKYQNQEGAVPSRINDDAI